MGITALTWITVLMSMGGLYYLCLTDAKRIRAHREKPHEPASESPHRHSQTVRRRLALFFVLVPGAVLLQSAEYGAFIMWSAAVPTVGWLMVHFWPQVMMPKSRS